MTDRRKFLKLTGGGVILAAAGAGVFLGTRTPVKALSPWKNAGSSYTEPRKRALSYAILAPNPHNRQPWIADLSRENEITLNVDLSRLLPETDPYHRQITIGLGCFLELLVQAAAEDGYEVTLDLFPDGSDTNALNDGRIAVARFVQASTVTREPLFKHVLQRRSLKEPFDQNRQVAKENLEILMANQHVEIGVTREPNQVQALRQLTWDAHVVEATSQAKLMETVDLMRLGKAEIEANPDGVDLGGAFLETLMLTGLLTRESLADPESEATQQGMDLYREIMFSAQAHVCLTTKTNTRIDQINAGRDWVRVNLAATSIGLGLHPISQSLQEYSEMQVYYKKVHKLLAPSGGTVQMLGRLGYAESVSASPRWALEHKLKNV